MGNNVNEVKDRIQQKALETHREYGGFSTLAMCTGAGKSRCGVLRAVEIVDRNPDAKILLGCFTTDQRDNVWRKEFEEWGHSDIYEKNVVERVCYVSLPTIIQQEFDLVLLDEAHHLTEKSVLFFELNKIHSILALTATPPIDKVKRQILDAIAPISFVYSVEQGIKDGVVASFEIDIIYTEFEGKIKTVSAGSKAKPFKQTEVAAYNYWDGAFKKQQEEYQNYVNDYLRPLGWATSTEYMNVEKMERNRVELDKRLKKERYLKGRLMSAMSKRTQLIYNALNKTRIAKRLINEFCVDEERYLFFAGSIEQSEEILPNQTYNSNTDNVAFNKFMDGEINKLAAVRGLNEGTNIKDLDYGIVLQLNSKELDIVQRIGRVIRIRPNHVGKIIIICVKNSRDQTWLKKSLKNMKFIPIREYTEDEFFESIK